MALHAAAFGTGAIRQPEQWTANRTTCIDDDSGVSIMQIGLSDKHARPRGVYDSRTEYLIACIALQTEMCVVAWVDLHMKPWGIHGQVVNSCEFDEEWSAKSWS